MNPTRLHTRRAPQWLIDGAAAFALLSVFAVFALVILAGAS